MSKINTKITVSSTHSPVAALYDVNKQRLNRKIDSKEEILSENISDAMTPSINSQSFQNNLQTNHKNNDYFFPSINNKNSQFHVTPDANNNAATKQTNELEQFESDKNDYLRAIGDYSASAMRAFQMREKHGCSEAISHIIRCALAVKDYGILKKAHNLLGYIHVNFGEPELAVKNFRLLRDIADEEEDMETKMYGYKQMGLCYQSLRMYEKASKCFKKQLELAWNLNDITEELSAYDNIGMQYYYLGDLEKARYYHDRMVRGKSEAKESIVRKISENQSKTKKAESVKKNEGIRDITNFYAAFKNLQKEQQARTSTSKNVDTTSHKGIKKTKSSTTSKKDANEDSHNFNSFKLNENGPILIRAGTPISDISNSGLPSPKAQGQGKGKAINLLPHYPDGQNDDPLINKKYYARHVKNFNPILGNNKNKKKSIPKQEKVEIKTKKELLKQRLRSDFADSLPTFDKKELLRKAKLSKQQQPNHFISLNHLSPSRNLKNFKRLEELNTNKALIKFGEFQKNIKDEIKGEKNPASSSESTRLKDMKKKFGKATSNLTSTTLLRPL